MKTWNIYEEEEMEMEYEYEYEWRILVKVHLIEEDLTKIELDNHEILQVLQILFWPVWVVSTNTKFLFIQRSASK